MQLSTFNYESNKIRVVLDEQTNTPLWIAQDVCDVLGYQEVSKTVSKLDDDEKLIRKFFVSGQNRDMICVNESGLYTLILRSNKPEAKAFKRWVTHEVLPTIRKTGSYEGGFFDAEKAVQFAPSIFTRLIDLRDSLWREALYMGYNGKCFYTGKCLNFDAFHVDHVLPQSRGGMDTLDNLVLCDPSYNMSKQAIVVSEMELNGYRQRIIVEFAPKVVALYESKRSGIVADGVSVNTLMNTGMMKHIEKSFGTKAYKALYRQLIPALNTPEALEDERIDQDDTLSGFIECYIVQDQNARAKSRDVYEAYLKWCSATNVEPLKMPLFTAKFKTYRIGIHKTIRFDDGQSKGYIGFTVAPMGGAL